MNRDELNRIKDAVLLTVAEQMGLDPFDLTVADRKRCDLTVDAALPLLREQIAGEIEALAVGQTFTTGAQYAIGVQDAARIARGEQP